MSQIPSPTPIAIHENLMDVKMTEPTTSTPTVTFPDLTTPEKPLQKTWKEKTASERLGWYWYHDNQFVHSWFIQDPRIMFALRLLLSCWLVGIYIAAWSTTSSPTYFLTYFTNLSYTGLMFSEITLTIISFFRMTRGPKANEKKATPYHPWTFTPFSENKWLRGLVYTVVPPQVSIHLVVVIVYWSLLANGFQFLSFAQHGLEFVVAFIEFFLLGSYQISFVSCIFQLTCGILFMFYAWVLNATVAPPGSPAGTPSNGYWVYGFLNWNYPVNAAYYIMVIVLFVIGLAVMYGVGMGRDKLGRKTLAKKGITLESLEREASGGDVEMVKA